MGDLAVLHSCVWQQYILESLFRCLHWCFHNTGVGQRLDWVSDLCCSFSLLFTRTYRYWSNAALEDSGRSPTFYISVYALIMLGGLIISTVRWFVLYSGSIQASNVLYNRMLETVLFAKPRFHDTTSRGSLLNRFGKDFEGRLLYVMFLYCCSFFTGIDSRLSDAFGRTLIGALSVITTIATVSVVGGPIFVFGVLLLGSIYWNGRCLLVKDVSGRVTYFKSHILVARVSLLSVLVVC